VKCWVARSASKTHIRIQLEPFPFAWQGWDIREGTISQTDMRRLETTTDEVEMERLHQEAWARAAGPRGRAVYLDGAPADATRDLA
jgi:hypothetical protein